MGTVYYLWRDDTETAYELGKLWDLREVFDSRRGASSYGNYFNIVREEDVDVLAEMLEMALWNPEHPHRGSPSDADIQWVQDIARDIARWSEGKPFRFLSENASELDRAADREQDAWLAVQRALPNAKETLAFRHTYVTGSLYRPGREREIPRPRNAAEQRRLVGSHYWLALEMLFHGIALIVRGFRGARGPCGILGGYERGLLAEL